MPYLSQVIGTPVHDASGAKIGTVRDLGAAVGEVFPRITALAFEGPAKAPLMVSWRKYVESYTPERIDLNVNAADVRFSYMQADELLLKRDLMNKQVVDTQGKKAVRVTDLKLSLTGDDQLRLLGAEVGMRGRLRSMPSWVDRIVSASAKTLGMPINERVIAWSYLDLIEKELPEGKLPISHRSLDDLHPADIAAIVQQLDPELRAQVLSQLDTESAAATMSELEGDIQTDVIDALAPSDASAMIAEMDPDDAADIIGELDPNKAEELLSLMNTDEQRAIRQLLGYSTDTAGGIMTSEFVAVPEAFTVAQARARIAKLDEDLEAVFYVYTLDARQKLSGVILMRDLIIHDDTERLADFTKRDIIKVSPEADQAEVAEEMSKYNLLGIPVVDDTGKILGVVTVDDALDVIETEHERDLQLASGTRTDRTPGENRNRLVWLARRMLWVAVWVLASAITYLVAPFGIATAIALLMPPVLLVAENLTAFASSYLIDDDTRPPFVGLIIRNAFIGCVTGFAGWLLITLMFWCAGTQVGDPSLEAEFITNAKTVLMCSMIAVGLLVVCAAPYTRLIEHRVRHDKAVPGTLATLCCMGLALVIYLGLAALMLAVF